MSPEDRETAASLIKKGNKLKREGKLPEAVAAYRRCIELNPNSAWSHNNLGEVLDKLRDFNGAIAAYNKAIELNRNSPWFYNNLGESLFKQGNWDKAIKYYRYALNLKPDFDISYKNSGDAYYKKGWLEKALKYYEKAVEFNKKDCDSCEKIGDLLAIKNQWDEAVNYYKMAGLSPGFSFEDRLIKLGKMRQQQGRLPQAVQLYRKAVRLKESQREKLPILMANKGELAGVNLELNKQIIYAEIHPEITCYLKPPKTVHPSVHPNFLELEKRGGNSSVVVIPGGSVWIDDPVGIAIASSKGKILIKDLFQNPDIINLPLKKLPPPLELDDTTAFLSIRKGQNYSHWMLDLLPKIGLLRESGIDLKSIGKFVVSSHSERPFQRETLEALGIPSDKIVESLKHPYIKAKTLIVPSLIPKISRLVIMQGWACEFTKKEFIKPEVRQKLDISAGVYINRKDASYRRVVNESEVVEFLSKFGIKSVTLSSMSVKEQALLFAGAKVVIAPHGAGLINTVFCNSGTKVIEFVSPDSVRTCYHQSSNHCNLDYYYLLGESVDAAQQDFNINIDLLSDLMKLAGVG